MEDDLEKIPASFADLALIFSAVAIEIVAATTPDPKAAEKALEQIANGLHDAGQRAGNERSRVLLTAVSNQVIATEEGSGSARAIFKNRQWAVTEYGLESFRPQDFSPPYAVAAERLTETTDRGNGKLYDWPVHMAEKKWVDIDAFIEAFAKALEVHKGAYPGKVNRAMLEASFAEARRIARHER